MKAEVRKHVNPDGIKSVSVPSEQKLEDQSDVLPEK